MGDPIPTSGRWTQAGGLEALSGALEYALSDRREFMQVLGASLCALAEQWLAMDSREVLTVLDGGRVANGFVSKMEEGLPRLRLLEAAQGGHRARRLIDAELGMVVEVLEKATYSASTGSRLYRLAAELARMAGWASFDAGFHSAAQRYWIAGLHASHAAEDRLLGANILKSMSLQCHDFSRPREALVLAECARSGAGSTTYRAGSMFVLREARAHAALGDRLACERLLLLADDLFDRSDDEEVHPSWLGYFDESEFNAQVGTCYLLLKDAAKANRYLSRTLRLVPGDKVRDRATYVIRLASAQLELGDADQALALAETAASLIRQAPSERNVRRLLRVRGLMPFPPADSRSVQLDEQLAQLAGQQ